MLEQRWLKDKVTIRLLPFRFWVQAADLSALSWVSEISRLSGVAPVVYCERLHWAFAQSLDVVQEAGWSHDVRRSWESHHTFPDISSPEFSVDSQPGSFFSHQWGLHRIWQPGWPRRHSASPSSTSLPRWRWWDESRSCAHPVHSSCASAWHCGWRTEGSSGDSKELKSHFKWEKKKLWN